MGLDVYLYSAGERAASDAHNLLYNQIHGYDNEDEKSVQPSPWDGMDAAARKAWREENPYPRRDDVDSPINPGHLFKKNYLRSSYNNGGFNRAVPEMLGRKREDGDLYWVFRPLLDAHPEYESEGIGLSSADVPALIQCQARAQELADALEQCDMLRSTEVSSNVFSAPPNTDSDGALAWTREQLLLARRRGESYGWSSLAGDFFGTEGITLIAAVPGRGALGNQGVHLIWQAGDEGRQSYMESARITAEFCDYAVHLIGRDGSAYMSWSG